VVAARIATDPAWRDAYASLHDAMASVSAELGRWAPEEPMPADVAARLDAALAATPGEADAAADRPGFLDLVARSTDPAGWGHAAGPDQVPAASTSRPVDGPAEAVAPEPAEAPAPQLSLVHGDPAGGEVPDPVREAARRSRRARRLRWAAPIAVAAGVLAFAGFALDHLAVHNDAKTASAGSGAARVDAQDLNGATGFAGQVLATGTNYTHATLGTAPVLPKASAFAASRSAPAPAAEQQGSPKAFDGSALERLAAPGALEACLAAIEQANAGGAISVESVDYARFSGKPAVIVRFSADNGRWAWASGAGCGTPAGDAATLDKVPVG
jgi:hypothetical protein